MADRKVDLYEGVTDRKEIIQTMRSNIWGKWQRLADSSEIPDKIHETIPKDGKAFVVKTEERKVTKSINQLISRHTYIKYMISRIDSSKSELCDTCKRKE